MLSRRARMRIFRFGSLFTFRSWWSAEFASIPSIPAIPPLAPAPATLLITGDGSGYGWKWDWDLPLADETTTEDWRFSSELVTDDFHTPEPAPFGPKMLEVEPVEHELCSRCLCFLLAIIVLSLSRVVCEMV